MSSAHGHSMKKTLRGCKPAGFCTMLLQKPDLSKRATARPSEEFAIFKMTKTCKCANTRHFLTVLSRAASAHLEGF